VRVGPGAGGSIPGSVLRGESSGEASGPDTDDQSSLEPGQSIQLDGELVRTYSEAAAWYKTRLGILQSQKLAFAKDGYQAPAGWRTYPPRRAPASRQ